MVFCPGVDEAMVIVLTFSGNRMAVVICSVAVQLPNDATIIGTKGVIKVGDRGANYKQSDINLWFWDTQV